MRCEIVAVGTELLLGQSVDTNSTWIGEQLASAGVDSYFQTKVGDNLQRIAQTLQLALRRSDAVIMCGGLGPTPDDISREAIAAVMNTPLIRRPELVARIRELFIARGREMPDNNLRQADVPRGAEVIRQMPGTAPGLICPVKNKVIYAVPGVPYEMREMISNTVIPDLRRRAGIDTVIKSRTLRTWGESESGLAELLRPRIEELDQIGNPTLAFLASGIEGLKVRITAKAANETEANKILTHEEIGLRKILGRLVFGIDEQSMESVVLDMLRRRGHTLAVAESVTGGMVGARLTAVPAASEVFRGTIVAYSAEIKSRLLGVSDEPAVSESAATAMALGVRSALNASVGLAVTGVAGPATQGNRPTGTVFLGLALEDRVEARKVQFPAERERIRQLATISLLNLLRLSLLRDAKR